MNCNCHVISIQSTRMTRAESSRFYEKQQSTQTRALIGSYAFEFLPMAVPEPPDTFSSMVSLGCGYGHELVAARIHFGEGIQLTGVDNDSSLASIWGGKRMLHQSLGMANATFCFQDASDVHSVLSQIPEPDIIAVRHPGPLTSQSAVEDVYKSLYPWMRHAVEAHKIMIVSTLRFQTDVAIRNVLAQAAAQLAGDTNVKLLKKSSTRFSWQAMGGLTTFEPDYYGFRIN